MEQPTATIERLYSEDGPRIWTYLRRHVMNRATADELFQETFVVATEKVTALMAADSQRAWLFGIARNLMREKLRRPRRETSMPFPEEHTVPIPEEEDPRLETMKRQIEILPSPQREVVELRIGQELSYAEIAEALAIPIGTVRSRMHNAVQTLRTWATATDCRPSGKTTN